VMAWRIRWRNTKPSTSRPSVHAISTALRLRTSRSTNFLRKSIDQPRRRVFALACSPAEVSHYRQFGALSFSLASYELLCNDRGASIATTDRGVLRDEQKPRGNFAGVEFSLAKTHFKSSSHTWWTSSVTENFGIEPHFNSPVDQNLSIVGPPPADEGATQFSSAIVSTGLHGLVADHQRTLLCV